MPFFIIMLILFFLAAVLFFKGSRDEWLEHYSHDDSHNDHDLLYRTNIRDGFFDDEGDDEK